jgi:hypothetical protein
VRGDVAGFGARCIGCGTRGSCVDEVAGALSVEVLWIHRLGGSGVVDFAKGSVKERGRAANGLVGLTAAAVETVGSAGIGGCVATRIFTGLRCAVGGSSSGTGGGISLRGLGAVLGRTFGPLLGEPWGGWAGARSLGGGSFAEAWIVGATLAGLAGLKREPERDLACWMAGPKRLEIRSVVEAGSEGVGLREGPSMSSKDLDVGTFSSSRVGWGVGVAEADERKA